MRIARGRSRNRIHRDKLKIWYRYVVLLITYLEEELKYACRSLMAQKRQYKTISVHMEEMKKARTACASIWPWSSPA